MPRYRATLNDESFLDFIDADPIEDLMASFTEHEYLIVAPIIKPKLKAANDATSPVKVVLFWNSVLLLAEI